MRPQRSALPSFLLFVWLITILLLVGRFANPAVAGDWPQILGPQRDGQAEQETVEPWTGEPTIRWKAACGAGYSGVAVARGKVFLWYRQQDHEVLDCLDTRDGRRLWQAKLPAIYRGGVDADRGPRCVPLVVGEQVFVYGAAGDLTALAFADGKTQWTRQLRTDYAADDGYFGAGSTPIVVGSTLIIAVGGRQDAGVVALDIRDGKTRWTAVDQEAAYASPTVIEIDGQRRLIAVLRLKTVMLDPQTGKLISEFDFGQRGPTVNAATPLVKGTELFVTASYGVGCRMLDMSATPPRDMWSQSEVIGSQYVTPVLIDGWLYAITGREDFGNGQLLSARWSDGKVGWQRPGFGTAHLIAVGDRVLAQHISGKLELIAADSEQFRSLAQAELPEGVYRSLPALADGTLYCRRTISPTSGELIAVELK